MSVQGCFTDFHIDFGGTSVWYHILRGGKVSLHTSSVIRGSKVDACDGQVGSYFSLCAGIDLIMITSQQAILFTTSS